MANENKSQVSEKIYPNPLQDEVENAFRCKFVGDGIFFAGGFSLIVLGTLKHNRELVESGVTLVEIGLAGAGMDYLALKLIGNRHNIKVRTVIDEADLGKTTVDVAISSTADPVTPAQVPDSRS